jgi:hypothetical protein
MSRITYQYGWDDYWPDPAITIELGSRKGAFNPENNQGAIHLIAWLAIDCPLVLRAIVRTSGEVVEASAEFAGEPGNRYWHLIGDVSPITDAQRKSLAAIHYGTLKPFGHKTCLGRPVCELAFAGLSREAAEELGGREPGSVFYN